jgi:hypothetical protein
LNDLTKKFDPQRHVGRTGPLIGLQELVGIYLERYLPKDRTVRCGVWSGVLSKDQKNCEFFYEIFDLLSLSLSLT